MLHWCHEDKVIDHFLIWIPLGARLCPDMLVNGQFVFSLYHFKFYTLFAWHISINALIFNIIPQIPECERYFRLKSLPCSTKISMQAAANLAYHRAPHTGSFTWSCLSFRAFPHVSLCRALNWRVSVDLWRRKTKKGWTNFDLSNLYI